MIFIETTKKAAKHINVLVVALSNGPRINFTINLIKEILFLFIYW